MGHYVCVCGGKRRIIWNPPPCRKLKKVVNKKQPKILYPPLRLLQKSELPHVGVSIGAIQIMC